MVRKRGLDLEEGSSQDDRSPETVSELRHLNVSLDPRLLAKVDARVRAAKWCVCVTRVKCHDEKCSS